MEGSRLSALFRKISPFSPQKLVRFSTSSATKPGFSSFFPGDSDGEGSLVYRHKLLFQRPTTMKWQRRLCNSVSFIGSVAFPVKKCPTRNGDFFVYTVLNVRSSCESDGTFGIFLNMWDKMAEISFKHLKQNDFIYVSGSLGSFGKVDLSGKLRTSYKVNVEELNYVACNGICQTSPKSEKSEPEGGTIPISSAPDLEKNTDRLYLWQVFFANPYEWWDNRQGKVNPRYPDFRHKDTGEALWLNPSDPPWVTRQLQLLDSKMAEQGHREITSSRSRVSMWKYE